MSQLPSANNWQKLISLRVWYAGGREVEYGLTPPDWVAQYLDEGTAQVIAGRIKLFSERGGYLSSRIELRKV